KVTIKVSFTGLDDVAGPTTTQQITVANGTTTTPKPTTTTPKPPADAIMGGQGYRSGSTGDKPCSFGFNAVDGNGDLVNITAGHCDPRPKDNEPTAENVTLGDTYLGAFVDKTVHDGDYTFIKIDGSVASRFKNNFVDTYGGDPVRITGTAEPVVGAPVCKSGQTSGYTCGVITTADDSTFTAKLCSIPGDSGGAMVTGTKALGILYAGSEWDCTPNKQTYGQQIKSILEANPGLKINTK
ncbi:S1 family peptidase, partial [Nocardia sp. NPDC005746]|uniref:S1 family peptidase n=1 Tax=Nocardia sp. NPDC005746 TaxID=3157062 RepID=UPI0033DCF0ED